MMYINSMNITIYTDGGNSLKNQIGGCSAVVTDGAQIIAELSEAYEGPNVTNNTMELQGVVLAGVFMLAHPEHGTEFTIVSDSEHVVNGATKWLAGWKTNGWKSKTGKVKNVEMWKAIDYLKSVLTIHFRWTKGHSTNTLRSEERRVGKECRSRR